MAATVNLTANGISDPFYYRSAESSFGFYGDFDGGSLTIEASFDDGTIRLWKSAVKNEQMMKIYRLEQEQQANKKGEMRGANAPVRYDISQVGYQQYDLVDKFDLFDNPHNERQDTDSDRNKIKSLYAVS